MAFSHIVVFWTDPAKPEAAAALIGGAKKYLNHQPGILHFHVGTMVKSERPVVDQSYAVALNIVFDTKQSHDDYQVDPAHVEFVDKVFKPNCTQVTIYDFEG